MGLALLRPPIPGWFQEPGEVLKAVRVLVPVLADAFGRTLKASPEDTRNCPKCLLKNLIRRQGHIKWDPYRPPLERMGISKNPLQV